MRFILEPTDNKPNASFETQHPKVILEYEGDELGCDDFLNVWVSAMRSWGYSDPAIRHILEEAPWDDMLLESDKKEDGV